MDLPDQEVQVGVSPETGVGDAGNLRPGCILAGHRFQAAGGGAALQQEQQSSQSSTAMIEISRRMGLISLYQRKVAPSAGPAMRRSSTISSPLVE